RPPHAGPDLAPLSRRAGIAGPVDRNDALQLARETPNCFRTRARLCGRGTFAAHLAYSLPGGSRCRDQAAALLHSAVLMLAAGAHRAAVVSRGLAAVAALPAHRHHHRRSLRADHRAVYVPRAHPACGLNISSDATVPTRVPGAVFEDRY